MQLCHQTGSNGYFMDDVPCLRGLNWGQMRGVLSEIRGSHPLGGLYNILDMRVTYVKVLRPNGHQIAYRSFRDVFPNQALETVLRKQNHIQQNKGAQN